MVLYSALYYAFFTFTSALFFVGAVPLRLLTWPFDPDRRILHLYSCAWAHLYFWIHPLWHLRVEGRMKLPWKGGAVLVANHQSLGDILVLFALYRPFKWVSKASVFRVPFLGWNMWLNGYVGLVRGNKDSIAKMISECEAWLDRKFPVLLFPEGTRSEDGEIKPFKDGAFRMAVTKNVPVYPIVLVGTGATLPKHGFSVTLRSDCVVRVLDPVDPAPFAGDADKLRDHVRDLMIAEKARMETERARRLGLAAPAHPTPAGAASEGP